MTTTRKRIPRREREQQMLDAAVPIFARDGFHAAGMAEIARNCGISKPMLYLYFESKEGLFIACIRRESDRLITMITEAVARGGSPKDDLWNGIRAFLSFIDQHRGAWSVLYRRARSLGEPVSSEVDELRSNMTTMIAGLLAHYRPDIDAETKLAAHTLVGACESLADYMLEQPDVTVEDVSGRLMDLMWPGLALIFDTQPKSNSTRPRK
ncbi:TetR/AcrR family transcriptional regulator [Haloglycomyces albus]|uniref:TetR/AcrR family transcriptional regulator n=1 Tax=Haloglycomyces albus TaxID=526067 RepID=UPI00046CA0AB|nr:TetR/AcrR family transcriptional regulator [Haloglycomyces albus]